MKLLLWLLLLMACSAVHAATPHLNLELTLDPGTRQFQGKADLTTTGPLNPALDPLFHISRVSVNGVAVPVANGAVPDLGAAAARPATGGAPQRLSLAYSGTLPALPQGRSGRSPDPG